MGLLSRKSVDHPSLALHVKKSIDAYQGLLRLNNTSCLNWLRLGQAYQVGCRWTPSLKSLEQCVAQCELNTGQEDTSEGESRVVVACCQVTALRCLGQVNVAIGNHEDAIEHARNGLLLLSSSTSSTSSTPSTPSFHSKEHKLLSVTLAMALLQLSRRHMSSDLFGHAHSCATEGLAVLSSSSTVSSSSEQKMTGDLHALLGVLPYTVHPATHRHEGVAKQLQHLQQSYEAYESVLSSTESTTPTTPTTSSSSSSSSSLARVTTGRMLLDVAVSSFRLVRASRRSGATGATGAAPLARAREALGRIIEGTPDGGRHNAAAAAEGHMQAPTTELVANAWNALGVIEASECSTTASSSSSSSSAASPVVAQYCFARAIKLLNGNHAQAWSNIGFLYLKCGHATMAMNAFMTSQSLSPASSVMWCGLGMATTTTPGNSNQERKERQEKGYAAYHCAMEFFPHLQAKVGMGLTALDMGRTDVAMIALQRAYDENPLNPEVTNALGVVAAHYELHEYALRMFQTTVEMLQAVQEGGGGDEKNNLADMLSVVERNIQRTQAQQTTRQATTADASISLERWSGSETLVEAPNDAVQKLLEMTETKWWNCKTNAGAKQSSFDANLFAQLWLDLSRLLHQVHHHAQALSCARFAVCLASHGTAAMSSFCLLQLGELLQSGGGGGGGETKEEGGVHQTTTRLVFAELGEQRPRWIQIPLAFRPSCSCAKTAHETAVRAVKENPASKEAWDKLNEWSV